MGARRTVIAAAVFGISLIFLYLRVSSSTDFAMQFESIPADTDPGSTFHPELDPKRGARMPQFAYSSKHLGKPVLVVYGGSCSSCSLHTFDPKTIDVRPYGRVALLYQSTATEIPQYLKHLGTPYTVLSDPSGVLPRALNAAWYPRFYEFSSDGLLLALQRQRGERASFIHLKEWQ